MAEPTKADLQARIDELTEIVQRLQQGEGTEGATVISAEGQASLREAVAEYRVAQQAPDSTDQLGMLAAAGRTLADRVDGVLNS